MNNKYEVYVAGPFFNPHQTDTMERIEAVLEKHGFKMFRPRFDSVDLSKDSSEEARKQAFEDDVNAIIESDFILANTMDKDLGTLFEVGYAYAKEVPSVGFLEGLPKGAPFNIMLAGSMEAVYTSTEELDTAISSVGKDKFIELIKAGKLKPYSGSVE